MDGVISFQEKIYNALIHKTGLLNRYQFYLFFILYGACVMHFTFVSILTYMFQQAGYECNESDSDNCTDYVCSLPIQQRLSYIPSFQYHSLADDLNMDFRCEYYNTTGLVYLLIPITVNSGKLFFSAFSNSFGRKNTLLITTVLMLLGICIIVMGGLIKSILIIIFGLTVTCTGSSISFQCACCIASEVVCQDWRTHYLNLLCTSYGLGQIVDLAIYKYVNQWQPVFIYFYITPLFLLIILIFFFVQKTPYDLLTSESEAQIMKVLRKISQVNSISFKMTLFQVQKIKNDYSIIISCHQKKFPILQLFGYQSLRKIVFQLMFLNFMIGYIFFSAPLLMDNSATTITDPRSMEQTNASLIDGITVIAADFLVFFSFTYLVKSYMKIWLGLSIIYIQLYFIFMARQSSYICRLIFICFKQLSSLACSHSQTSQIFQYFLLKQDLLGSFFQVYSRMFQIYFKLLPVIYMINLQIHIWFLWYLLLPLEWPHYTS